MKNTIDRYDTNSSRLSGRDEVIKFRKQIAHLTAKHAQHHKQDFTMNGKKRNCLISQNGFLITDYAHFVTVKHAVKVISMLKNGFFRSTASTSGKMNLVQRGRDATTGKAST